MFGVRLWMGKCIPFSGTRLFFFLVHLQFEKCIGIGSLLGSGGDAGFFAAAFARLPLLSARARTSFGAFFFFFRARREFRILRLPKGPLLGAGVKSNFKFLPEPMKI